MVSRTTPREPLPSILVRGLSVEPYKASLWRYFLFKFQSRASAIILVPAASIAYFMPQVCFGALPNPAI